MGVLRGQVSADNPIGWNLYYLTEEIPEPVISPRAVITFPELKGTLLYDIPTNAGTTVTLVAQ